MRIFQNKNVVTIIGCLVAIGILLMVIGFVWLFIEMMIDHECYQLTPNEYYQSSICEKYWKPIEE